MEVANIVPHLKTQQRHRYLLQVHIPPLSNCKDTGDEPSYICLHNRKHTKHTHATQHSTDGTTHSKQHRIKGVQPNGSPAQRITVALDINKAFDTININTLIRKLLQTKILGTIIKFIVNYIKGRKAYTSYINHTSSQCQFNIAPIVYTQRETL